MNKKNTKFNYGWVILTILCLGLALANYSQYQVSAFGTQITAEMNLTATVFNNCHRTADSRHFSQPGFRLAC